MKPYGSNNKSPSAKIGPYCCERCSGPSKQVKNKRRRKERSKARQNDKKEIKDQDV